LGVTGLRRRSARRRSRVPRGGRDRATGRIEAAVPLSNLAGKTPGQTIYSILYAEARRTTGSASRPAGESSASTPSASDEREGLRVRSADARRGLRPGRRRQGRARRPVGLRHLRLRRARGTPRVDDVRARHPRALLRQGARAFPDARSTPTQRLNAQAPHEPPTAR
jgi:hypothetical protein